MNRDPSLPHFADPKVSSILKPGHNCWRVDPASRVAFLVDADDYFRAFRSVVEKAQHTLLIVGWDLHSRMVLIRDSGPHSLPERLGAFLNHVVARRKGLRAYVLTWDFAMLFALEREWLPIFKLGWKTPRRLKFRMDDQHPVGASHHQKVVVVDDHVAFAGGLDFADSRWDTREHRPDDPRRENVYGMRYPPFHDIQMMVEGKAARSLGDLVRDRWYWATGEKLPKTPAPGKTRDLWPLNVPEDLREVPVAISRTLPEYDGRPEVREVEALYLDTIRAARRWIYIENQYFTSKSIADALAARLAEDGGPEVVLVLPQKSSGWLEQSTMDVLRARLLKQLRAADSDHRLAVYCPHNNGLQERSINVHSKILVVDDDWVRVGSANLSNRSMGFDTECDLTVEARGEDRVRGGIRAFRNGLLAEHLGVEPETVHQALDEKQSLIQAVDRLRGRAKTLRDLDYQVTEEIDNLVPESALIDPERTVDLDRMIDLFLPREEPGKAKRKVPGWAKGVLVLAGLALLWNLTPLGEWLKSGRALALFAEFKDHPAAPFWALGSFLVGGLIAVPVTILIAVTVLIFGPIQGFLYSLAGTGLSALLVYGIGHWMGRNTVSRLAGTRLNRLSRMLGKKGLMTVITVRTLPIAPFSVVNLVAGASHIRFRDYALGTLIGMVPGMAALVVLVDRFGFTLKEPSFGSVAVLFLVSAAIGTAAWGVRRFFLKRSAENKDSEPSSLEEAA